ncbi:uncharacterized protein LOC111896377 [Lactuca sativa]|uniref:Maternal effect embryo arrest 59 n=1 Tax=Lactuca sativa TaxID=4236 RepID=A0A9R1XGP3_LACSA|nr:uncharacterized protein LOC111896377 [Lactuca sativa]KAJ0209389.1 hypothetical protein LSAT_V11C400219740 [Lactuca sativa]
MIGQPEVTVKPSRSDEIIDPDQQLQISEQVRSHFDSILPKRPSKPNRSDPDYISTVQPSDESVDTIPEFLKFQTLKSQSQGIVSDRNGTVEDEFVETEYYKELVSIDKEHHTTGNGFIKVAKEENGDDDLYDLRLQIGADGRYRDHIVKSNPATNDWIPSSGDCYDQDEYLSLKPNRSEN